jgi:hypothetical protein
MYGKLGWRACLLFFYVLQLKANVLGTEYLLRGRGGDSSSHKGFNAQLLAVNYKPTINHMQAAPRTMTAVLPVPESKVRPSPRCAAAATARGHHCRLPVAVHEMEQQQATTSV